MAEETGRDGEDEQAASADSSDASSSTYGENRSEVDAMGNDKRRVVIGGQYGATVRKRLVVYGAVVGFVAVLAIVFLTVVTNYDQRDVPLEETAPWAVVGPDAEPPRDVDFKANGPRDCPSPCDSDVTIPADDIVNR